MFMYMHQSGILKCPFTIFMPEHYTDAGTCKCYDRTHRHDVMIKEWEYTPQDFLDAHVVTTLEEV